MQAHAGAHLADEAEGPSHGAEALDVAPGKRTRTAGLPPPRGRAALTSDGDEATASGASAPVAHPADPFAGILPPAAAEDGVGPNRSYELVVHHGDGAGRLTFKLKGRLGGTWAAETQRDWARLKAVEPKLSVDLRKRAKELAVTLVQSEFDLTEWNGLTLFVKLQGPSLSTGKKSVDLNVARVAVVGRGDVSAWLASLVPPSLAGLVTWQLEVEGSLTIGGKLLTRLLEVDAVGKRLTAQLDELDRATSELERLARQEKELVEKRAGARARQSLRDRLTRGRGVLDRVRSTVAGQRELKAVEDQLARVRESLRKQVDAADLARHQFQVDARQVDKLLGGRDGKLARKLFRRFGAQLARRAASIVARVVPVLNVIAFIEDVRTIRALFLAWRDSGFALPTFGGGGGGFGGEEDGGTPGGDGDSGSAGGDGDGGAAGGEGATGAGGGSGDGAGDARRADGGEETGGADGADADGGGKAGRADADGGGKTGGADARERKGGDGLDTVAAREALHRPARAVADALEHTLGVALDADQVRAFGELVPADLDDDATAKVIQHVAIGPRRARTPDEVLDALRAAVRDESGPVTRPDGVADSSESAGPVRHPDGAAQGTAGDEGPVTQPGRDTPGRSTARGGRRARAPGQRPRRGRARQAGSPGRGGVRLRPEDVASRVKWSGTAFAPEALDHWLAGRVGEPVDDTGAVIAGAEASLDRNELTVTFMVRRASGATSMRYSFFLELRDGRVHAHEGIVYDINASDAR